MAEALLGVAVQNLVSLLQNEFSTISGINSKAQKLSNTLVMINAVLEDAERKQVTDHALKLWLQQLRDAVYVLDDILDECSIESTRLRGLSAMKPKNIMFRREIGNRLKDITRRFDDIDESKNKFLLRDNVIVRESPKEVVEWRQTSSFIAEPKVYGRDNDKEKIVEFLLNQSMDDELIFVCPIIGLGGVGKTTFAQLVYNDHRVNRIFLTKVWVCVSEAFSVKGILCSIIESITSQKCDVLDLDVIQRKVQDLLRGKRYLLVLDDVWNKNQELEFGLSQEKWNKLKSVLSCGSKGSSILVSTRDEVVASTMGTCQAHRLSGLSEEECWLLFKQYAFGDDSEEQAMLVVIGKEIAKKCGGLPLAAQTIGGLMRSRSGEKEWLEIKESKLWELPHDNYILPALKLSYIYLTPTLKQCFSFCAIFPKDMIMKKEELIHLWMANGFISSRENLEVEDVGSMIWNELCQKSFFQDIKMDDYNGNISFKMHDLVHDLAQSIVGKECISLENTDIYNLSKNTHHISCLIDRYFPLNEGALKKLESLRTLFQLEIDRTLEDEYIPTNRSLRVLCTNVSPLSSLGNLIHLRYLKLCGLGVKTLPNSIYGLKKLEILILKSFENLSSLPKGLVCLKHLRHLVIEDCRSLSRIFPYIGKLSYLRTLTVYIVDSEEGHSLAELCYLNLGGKLKIEGLKDVGSLSEALKVNLMGKKDLQELCLSWKDKEGVTKTPIIDVEQVIEALKPHTNLKRLKIEWYDGICFPRWITILTSLVALNLTCFKNCVDLSSLCKLPSLKKLKLYFMDKIKYMDDDESHDGMETMVFPSLEELQLVHLSNLEGLLKVEREKMFPCLSNLRIFYCPKLGLPCLPSLKEISVNEFNNELLLSISSFYGLTTLELCDGKGITSFLEGMFRNLNCLKSLHVSFRNSKELPNEPFNLALERLVISGCKELEYLPELIWEGINSLRSLNIYFCEKLKYLPEGIRHLNSLELLRIHDCPTLEERCKEGTGEDWEKIADIPNIYIGYNAYEQRKTGKNDN